MRHTTTVVVGAGHCGLAMSRRLAERSVDHVVLERGEVANSWRTQRWDSLRLLTPNWMTRLPGFAYRGDDPDGYLGAPEVAALIADYAAESAAPVLTGTTVTSVRPAAGGYVVRTDRGSWHARTVVAATGAAGVASVPAALAAQLPARIPTTTAADYRNPDQLPPGGVLVVGASASGVQIAEELHRSGRPVTLAVGEHVRMPRTYRGRDILWWMDASGVLDERYDEIAGPGAGAQPAVDAAGRLAGPDARPERAGRDRGAAGRPVRRRVRRAGPVLRLAAQRVRAGRPEAGPAAGHPRRLGRPAGVDAEPPQRFAPTARAGPAALSARLGAGGIESIVWATGYRPDLSWLDVDVFDRRGRVVHDGGVTACPGLYLMGLPFLRRRKSTLIDGAAARRPRAGRRTCVGHLDATARRPSGLGGRRAAPHPVAADVRRGRRPPRPAAAGRCAHRDRAAARPAARRPDRGARPR